MVNLLQPDYYQILPSETTEVWVDPVSQAYI